MTLLLMIMLLLAVVLGYSLSGTLITALIGRRLVRLNFDQLGYEAGFRYSLVRVRDHTESIPTSPSPRCMRP
ncbi:hypothetical protein DSCA_38640 [Desulfosarcina alkanivorans]|uniref:ABC transmembrane type-1 domain-containing protein n=1 Tax=Desulfosarcina alkanivorans TaxID=571177 RepID=A0A5K7YUG8_9BACT|nr:SbmA/BacA-like family transporter [Desulfosarcina alkanivorans]BBO69934.1 hypothetical protein DSCA_38640 [Desulfosarcina alkanivorans]